MWMRKLLACLHSPLLNVFWYILTNFDQIWCKNRNLWDTILKKVLFKLFSGQKKKTPEGLPKRAWPASLPIIIHQRRHTSGKWSETNFHKFECPQKKKKMTSWGHQVKPLLPFIWTQDESITQSHWLCRGTWAPRSPSGKEVCEEFDLTSGG